MLDDLFEFLQGAVTPYHAAAIAAAWLDAAGKQVFQRHDAVQAPDRHGILLYV